MATSADISTYLARVEQSLQTARVGYDDHASSDRSRSAVGLRNFATFARAVGSALQGLQPLVGTAAFDRWQLLEREALSPEPMTRFLLAARHKLERQGSLETATFARIRAFRAEDIGKFQPPPGATQFFMGDQLGGSGWIVPQADGSDARYYIHLPPAMAAASLQLGPQKLTASAAPETGSLSPLALGCLERLGALLIRARQRFIPPALPRSADAPLPRLATPSYLRLIK